MFKEACTKFRKMCGVINAVRNLSAHMGRKKTQTTLDDCGGEEALPGVEMSSSAFK